MDLFRLLGSGAKFDKKRFQADVQLFEGERKADKSQAKNAAATDPKLRAEILSEIDILADDDQKKKQKQQREQDGEDDNATSSLPTTVPGTPTVFETVEQANEFRKRHRIKIYGNDVPNPFATFEDLASAPYDLLPTLYNNVKQSKYATPTPIQMQSIPIMMKGRDVIACAPTGSGKTLAYLLPILQDLKEPQKVGYRALIIAPTRELAQQIDRELHKIGAGLKFKVNLMTKATAAHKAQTPQSRQKFDILISTPLRLVHAIQEKEIDLSRVRHLVLDEADKLMDLGFLEQTDEIFAACSNDARKAMFSATFTPHVEDLATSVMKSPVRVVIGTRNAATDTIKQQLIYVGSEAGKLFEIRQLVAKGIKPPVLIFVQSIERAKELFHELVYDGINVDVIHSDRTKTQRENIINSFRQGKIWVLIATELMARGLDFKGVNLVINYDFPQSSASYIHRIGRTGRAGRMGEAVTYYTKDDLQYLKSIVNVMRESGCEVPDWMLHLKNPTRLQKKELKWKAVERETIDTTPKFDKRKEKMRKEMIDASKKRKRKQKQSEQQKNKKAKSEENNATAATSSPSSSSSSS